MTATFINYAFDGEQFQDLKVEEIKLMAMGDNVDTSYQINISRTNSILCTLQMLCILQWLGFRQNTSIQSVVSL